MNDFVTDPDELNLDFWSTDLGQKTLIVVTALDRNELPDQAVESLRELMQLHHSGDKLDALEDFNASAQAIKLANLLTKSMNHYMPGGVIDDNRASPSDIKNLITTSSSVLKLINQIQGELYTADRMAAMERAIFKTFDDIHTDIPEMPEALAVKLKQSFRAKLEMSFSSL